MPIYGMKNGGSVKGPGTGTSDSVPIMASNGEYMLPADTTKALGGAKVLDKIVAATHTPTGKPNTKNKMTAMADGGMKRPTYMADGGLVEKLKQIPTDGNPPAPPAIQNNSTDLSRNVNNSMNALGGMGVVASVPLGVGKAAMNAMPVLNSPVQKIAMGPGANFVAGVGSNSVVSAAPVAKAIGTLPPVNVALQQGAQANALAGATRSMAGAGAGATALDNSQQNPVDNPAPQSEYSRQMGEVGGFFADAAKNLVGAPGSASSRMIQGALAPSAANPVASPVTNPAAPAAVAATGAKPALATIPAPAAAPASGVINFDPKTNTYSGTNVGADAQIVGGRGGGGVVSQQNQSAAQRLSDLSMAQGAASMAAPAATDSNATGAGVTGIGTGYADEIKEKNARTTINNQRSSLESAARLSTSPRDRTAAMQALSQFDQSQAQTAIAAAREAGDTTRAGMRETGESGRANVRERGESSRSGVTSGIARDRLAMDQANSQRAGTGIDLDNQSKQRLANAQNALLDPNLPPGERKKAEETLRLLQSQKETPNKFTVVPRGTNELGQNLGADVLDSNGNLIERKPAKPDAATAKAQAQAALKANPANKEEINKRLVAAGYPTI